MKKIVFFIVSCGLLMGLGLVSPVEATSHHMNHEENHHHSKEWNAADKEKVTELIKLGYEKHDIFHALKLSKLANVEAEKILAYYKENKSWKETAEHFGIDKSQLHHHHKWKKHYKFLEENKEKVVPYLASYLNKEEAELTVYLEDGAKLHTLVKASILSKLAGLEIEEILAKSENGQSFRDIAKELKIEKTDMIREMKKLKKAIEA